jgi:hypothetical protein
MKKLIFLLLIHFIECIPSSPTRKCQKLEPNKEPTIPLYPLDATKKCYFDSNDRVDIPDKKPDVYPFIEKPCSGLLIR